MNPFQKASRSQVFLKLAITGPTGSGKTLSALRLAAGLVEPGQRIAFEDTENDSASLYSDMTERQCADMKIKPEEREAVMTTSRLYDVMPIAPPFPAESFSSGIQAAVKAGYGVVVIDSASHLWKGILAFKDQIDSHGGSNKFTNWKTADAKFEPVIEAVLHSKIHVIFCMRSKMDYAQDVDSNGKKTVTKLGLAPIMRDGMEYEFSTVLDIGLDHSAKASKDRTGLFPTDKIFQVTEQTGRDVAAWLKTATPKTEPPPKEPIITLTEDERYNKNILKLRGMLAKNTPEGYEPERFEAAWCLLVATKCDGAKDRKTLEQFTLTELIGPVWDSRAWAVSEVVKVATEKEVAK